MASDPRVAAAYLFGSLASGKARKGSDADVAMLLERRAAARSFDVKLEYASKLEDILGRRVDLVILNQADPFLRFQVFSKGKLIFARDQRKALEFQVHSLNEYWDYLPIKRQIENAAIRQMAHGR